MRHKLKNPPGTGFLERSDKSPGWNKLMKMVDGIIKENYQPTQYFVHPNTYAAMQAHFYVDGEKIYQVLPVK